jgi:hypothetical protein
MFPPLPQISGERILVVYTHSSVSPTNEQERKRLYELGRSTLEMCLMELQYQHGGIEATEMQVSFTHSHEVSVDNPHLTAWSPNLLRA